MDNQFHFIVTTERGKLRSFVVSRDSAKLAAAAAFVLVLGGIIGFFLSGEYLAMRQRVASLESELASTLAANQAIRSQASKQAQNQQARLDNTLAKLKERSQLIESILSKVGVSLKVEQSTLGAGGPFRKQPEDRYQDLTLKVDRFLDAVRSVPLGPPVQGVISSPFGYRVDPINRRQAFHSGLDIKSDQGTRISAPADGRISEQGHTAGFGNYVEIDHGYSFRTRYYHLQKSLVTTGDKVHKGQLIALMGNSGRSTGPHLHYEIRYRNRLVDPLQFVQIHRHIETFREKEKS